MNMERYERNDHSLFECNVAVFSLRGREKSANNSVRRVSIPIDIRIEHLQNVSSQLSLSVPSMDITADVIYKLSKMYLLVNVLSSLNVSNLLYKYGDDVNGK
jgi:hypothetical protein